MEITITSQSLYENDFEAFYESGRKSNKILLVTHKGETLQWNVTNKTWNTTDVETTNTAFEPINRYLMSLPMTQQDAIFEVYREIRSVLASTKTQNSENCEDLIEATKPLAEKLFALIDKQHFYNWVWTVLRPNIPANIRSEFDSTTMPGTRERTYLLSDYHELIPLAIIVRMACPFWLDFIYLTKNSLSKELKDMHVYSIINKSWPAKSPGMERLREFVTHTVGNDKNHPAAVLMGIGSDDFVDWALSYVVVTRLPIVDVMGTNSTAPVAPALFSAIRARVQTITAGQPRIKKKFTETSSNDDNNQSFLEGFRSRMAVTIGQELTGTCYLLAELDRVKKNDTNPYGMLQRVAPGIDYALVRDAIKSCSVLLEEHIIDQQVNLAAWLFHPYSQCRAVGNLRKFEVVSLIAMAQAVFLHQGKVDLAILVSAIYAPNSLSSDTVIGEQIAPIRAAERAELAKNFPIEQRGKGTGRNPSNTVVDNVQEMVRLLQNYDISCTFSPKMQEIYRPGNSNPRYSLRKDASSMFMAFVNELSMREVVEVDPMLAYQQKYGTL